MIESREIEKLIKSDIERWCEYTHADKVLRDGDIYSLVSSMIDRFYRVTLCCGHKVQSINEGITLEFYEYDDHSKGTVQGLYCKDCAEEYKKDLGAWEVKHE